jgi:pyruvate dehydrogenase E1 component alpha subunit
MVNEQLDGFDVENVRDRVAAAREFARSGQGPVLLEVITYRHRGHSMSDPAKYRPDGELEEKKQSDPLLITKTRLINDFGLEEQDIKDINTRIDAQAQEAYRFADESPEADLNALYDYVYAP